MVSEPAAVPPATARRLGRSHRQGGVRALPVPPHGGSRSMIELERPADLEAYVGKEIGVSDWFTVDQAMIDKFADATGDHQWIHIDVERAKKEMPGGKTIAHGYLTLSLVPMMGAEILRITGVSRGINYGSNKVRFTNMVTVGSRVRGRQKLLSVEARSGGVQMI